MFKRIFSTTVILAIIAASLFFASGTQQPAFVNTAQAAPISLSSYAGMTAYTNIGTVTLDDVKSAFVMIEYEGADFIVGTLDLPLYESAYDPLVLVTAGGNIVAFYPNTDPAGKVADILSKNLDETLLEKAVKNVAEAAGAVPTTIYHYDFSNLDATNLLLVAEYEPEGNTFTLHFGAGNAYYEKSYAFYRTFAPSFTLDNESVEQVNFLNEESADYFGTGYYGTVYGHFPVNIPDTDPIDFDPEIEYTFSVEAGDHLGFGALAILYSGDVDSTVHDADFSHKISLVDPDNDWMFDLTPGVFDKLSPGDIATSVPLNPTLSWTPSTAPNYEYCIDTTNDDACNTEWISTGSDTSVALSNLLYETTYYWQVQAVNSSAVAVEANGGTWWSFTTADGVAPDPFMKSYTTLSEPIGSLSKVTMEWEESYGAYYYEVCVDTTPDCIAPEQWHNVGLDTTASIGGLLLDTTYYWQVRAWNGFDADGEDNVDYYTYADGGWVHFPTRTFSKLHPVDNEVYNLSLPFKWEETPIATNGYEYCIDDSAPDADPDTDDCNTEWIKATGTSVVVNFKKNEMVAGTYYWQVRTFGSEVEANDGVWWIFEVLSKKDLRKINLFKVNPVDGAVDQLVSGVELSWKSTGTHSNFEYCYFDVDDTDTTPISVDDTCTYPVEGENPWINWTEVGSTTTTISGLENATTYYWQVRTNLGTVNEPVWLYADKGDYWVFTTELESEP